MRGMTPTCSTPEMVELTYDHVAPKRMFPRPRVERYQRCHRDPPESPQHANPLSPMLVEGIRVAREVRFNKTKRIFYLTFIIWNLEGGHSYCKQVNSGYNCLGGSKRVRIFNPVNLSCILSLVVRAGEFGMTHFYRGG